MGNDQSAGEGIRQARAMLSLDNPSSEIVNLSFQWQRELKEKFDEKFIVLKGGDTDAFLHRPKFRRIPGFCQMPAPFGFGAEVPLTPHEEQMHVRS